jgi:hypothetical protein
MQVLIKTRVFNIGSGSLSDFRQDGLFFFHTLSVPLKNPYAKHLVYLFIHSLSFRDMYNECIHLWRLVTLL